MILLPGMVTVAIPIWVARRYGVEPAWPHDPLGIAAVLLGMAAGAIGMALFAGSVRLFATVGRGTLAPWDPPRRLVVTGLYRYVRNPMISGVLFILAGEALVLRSGPHAAWAAVFLGINAVYIPILEEPLLDLRFGEEYREYRRHVRRFAPRLTPWMGGDSDVEDYIAADELLAMIGTRRAPVILDVRSTAEYMRGHVPGALHVPFWVARSGSTGIPASESDRIVLYCGRGPRARLAAAALRRRGFSRVGLLRGHMAAWRRAGLRVEAD